MSSLGREGRVVPVVEVNCNRQYGVVLYYAIAHKPLLETTGADQLRGKAERIKLARWSTADLTYAINDLDHGGFLRTRTRACACV